VCLTARPPELTAVFILKVLGFIPSMPFTILNTYNMSMSPLRSTYGRFFSLGVSLVAHLWTFSTSILTCQSLGCRIKLPYSKCGRTIVVNSRESVTSSRHVKVALTSPGIWLITRCLIDRLCNMLLELEFLVNEHSQDLSHLLSFLTLLHPSGTSVFHFRCLGEWWMEIYIVPIVWYNIIRRIRLSLIVMERIKTNGQQSVELSHGILHFLLVKLS